MGSRRKFAKGAGCLGALGVSGAMGIAGILGLCGVGAWVSYRTVQTQWEGALRATMADTTGDEVTFGQLSIGVHSVTVYDVTVRDRLGGDFLHIDALSLQGDPRDLLGAPTAWRLDGMHLSGVVLRPERNYDGSFALPETSLALFRGERSFPVGVVPPTLVVPELTLDEASIVLDGHELTIGALAIEGGATLIPPEGEGGFTVQLGPADATGVGLTDPPIHIDRLRTAVGGELDGHTSRLVLEGTVLEGVELTLDGLSAGVPRVQADNDLVLDLAAGPSLTVGEVHTDGFRLTAGNEFQCRDVRARIELPLTLALDEVVVDELVVTGLRSSVTGDGWPAVDALLTGTRGARLPPFRAPAVTFHTTTIQAGAATATAATTTTSLQFAPGRSLTWGPGQVDGVAVLVGGVEQLGAERVNVSGGALSAETSGLVFERLGARGVTGVSTWTPDAFGVPDALLGLAAVRGGVTFQNVDVASLDLDVTGRSGTFPAHVDEASLTDLSLRPSRASFGTAEGTGVRLHDGAFDATVGRVRSSGGPVRLIVGDSLEWSGWTLHQAAFRGRGTAQLAAEQVDVLGGRWAAGADLLTLPRVAAQGVDGTVDWSAPAFGLPDAALRLSGFAGGLQIEELALSTTDVGVQGIPYPSGSPSSPIPVHLDQAVLRQVGWQADHVRLDSASASGIRLADGDFEATAAQVELTDSGRIGLAATPAIDWGALTARDVAFRGGGKANLSVEQLVVPKGHLDPATSSLELDRVTLDGVGGSIAWGAHAFGLPTTIFRLGGMAGGIEVDEVQIDRADVSVQGRTGTIPVHIDRIITTDARLDGEGWTVPGGTLTGVDASWERVRATVQTARLDPAGTVHLEGAEAWTRLNARRKLDLPPVASDHAPIWLGGSFRGTEPYFGVAFPGTPYTPTSIQAPALRLHLADEGIANPHHTWDVTVALALGPHDDSGHLPVSVDGEVGGGTLVMKGHLEPSGTIQADVGVRGLVLGELGMYLDDPMSRFKMRIEQGRGGAALRLDLRGSQISLRGTGEGRSLKMGGSAVAGVANTGFRAVKGSNNTVSIPIDIDGDLSDPSFSPFDLLLSSYVGGLHTSVARSLGNAVKGIGGPDEGVARAKQTGGGRNVDKAWGALKDAVKGGADDAVRASKPEAPKETAPPTNLLDTAADTGRPEAVDTGADE